MAITVWIFPTCRGCIPVRKLIIHDWGTFHIEQGYVWLYVIIWLSPTYYPPVKKSHHLNLVRCFSNLNAHLDIFPASQFLITKK